MEYFEKHIQYFKWAIPLVAFLLYANTISNDYNMDDELVTQNHRNTSRGFEAFSDILNDYYYEDNMGYKYEYRPVVHISFAIEHQLFGESPHISHFINVLLYAALCLLLFLVLSNLFPQNLKLLAWIATILFVFHPIHTEVVASIKNRDELLAVTFGLMYTQTLRKGVVSNSILFIAVSYMLFILALFSKMTVLVFPLVFPLLLIYSIKINKPFHLLIYASFVFMGVFFSSFDNLFFKVLISVSSILFFIGLYFEKEYTIFKRFVNIVKSNFLLNLNYYKQNKFNDFQFPVLKSSFSFSDRQYTFLIIGVSFFYFLGFTYLNRDINSIFSIILLALFLFSNFRGAKILLFLIPNALLFYFISNQDLSALFMLFLLILIWAYKDKRINVIFLFILSIIYSQIDFFIIGDINYQVIFLLIAFLITFFKIKKLFNYFTLTIILIMLVFFYIEGISNVYYFASILSIALFYFIFQFKYETTKTSFISFFYLVLILFGLATHISQNYFQEITHIENEIETIIEPTSKLAARPLNFVETPVNVHEPMHLKLATGMYIFGKYLQKTIIPYPMGFYYGYAYISPKTFNDVLPWVMLGVFLFLGLLSLYWILKKKYVLAFGLIIFLVGTFQALGIYVPIPGAMGDRFLFIPSIGFCILLAYPFYKAVGTKWQKSALVIFSLVLLSYGFLTIQRNFQWKDRITLFEADIEYLNESAQAQALLGYAYMRKATSLPVVDNANFTELSYKAKAQFEKAIAIYPNFLNWWYDKGRIESDLGLLDDALVSLKKSIEIEPEFLPDPYYNIASIYFYKQNFKEAAFYFEKTLEMQYSNESIYNTLVACYMNMGLFEKALGTSEKAAQLYPNSLDVQLNLGKVQYNMGLIDLAIISFNKARSISPTNPEILNVFNELGLN